MPDDELEIEEEVDESNDLADEDLDIGDIAEVPEEDRLDEDPGDETDTGMTDDGFDDDLDDVYDDPGEVVEL